MDTTGQNSTVSGNSTIPTNSTLWWWVPAHPGRPLQADIVACSVITFLIGFSFVAVRFYTRGRLNNVLGPSDWCILPALLCAAGVTASSLEQVAHGAGKHSWEVDPFVLPAFERAAWYGMVFYNMSLTLTRISILLLYKRIFSYTKIRRAIHVVLGLVIIIGIWLLVSVLTACLPLQAFWDWSLFWTTKVFCQPPNVWWANAALHISSDLVVMALPMPVLSTLNLPRRQKYALVGVFALGFFVCIISGLRLMSLIVVEREQPYDATYTSANMIYWTAVEVNASISCACIMTFKPLIQRLFPRLLSPSKDAREPALQWITPVTGTTTNNNNNNNANPDTSIRPNPAAAAAEPGPQPASRHTPSPSTNPFHRRGSSGSALCPHHRPSRDDSTADADHDDPLEKSRYYHGTLNPAAAYAYSLDDDDDDHDHDHAFDLHRDDGLDTDLEAQRPCACACACSVSSTTMGGGGALTATTTATTTTASHSGRSSVGGEEGGADGALDGEEERAAALRAPPRAHLGLGLGLRGTAAAAGVGDRRD